MPHGHGLKLLAATDVTVLEQRDAADDGVEFFLRLVHEDEVGHEGDEAHDAAAKLHKRALLEGHEHTTGHLGHLLQLLIGRSLGIWPRQIAQHIPAVFQHILGRHREGKRCHFRGLNTWG